MTTGCSRATSVSEQSTLRGSLNKKSRPPHGERPSSRVAGKDSRLTLTESQHAALRFGSYCFFSSVLPWQDAPSFFSPPLLQQELPAFSSPFVQAPSFFAPSLLQHPADLPSFPFVHSPDFLSAVCSVDFASAPLSTADFVVAPPIAELFMVCVVDFEEAVEASLCAFAAKAKKANALRIKIFFIMRSVGV